MANRRDVQKRNLVVLGKIPQFDRFHPIFLYQSLWNLLAFILMMWVARRYQARLLKGDMMLLYAILYPLGRFFVEARRPGYPGHAWWPLRHPLSHLFMPTASDPNTWNIAGIRVAQAVAIASILACSALLIYRHRRREGASSTA